MTDKNTPWQTEREAHRHALSTLLACLPPPKEATPAATERRNDAAIEAVFALQPANAAEMMLAVQYVAVNEQAKECLRNAGQPGIDPKLSRQWTTQAENMLRAGMSTARMLKSMQTNRQKRAAAASPQPVITAKPSQAPRRRLDDATLHALMNRRYPGSDTVH